MSSKRKRGAKEIRSLADLTPDPKNARKHNPRNVGIIEDALREVGAARSIVIDEDGVILAGNATTEAAANAFNGDVPVRVIPTDGREIIAVQRTGLSAREKRRLALFDNRAAELASWDAEIFEDFTPEDFKGLFSVNEVAAILDLEPEAGVDPNEEWKGMPEFVHEDKTAFRSLAVHFKDQEAVDRFAELVGQKITEKTRFLWYPEIEIERYADKRYEAEE